MLRGFMVLILVLGLVGLIFYFTLPEGKIEKNSGPPTFFCRTSKLVTPPAYASQKDPQRRITRLMDRVRWGTNHVVNQTIEMLVAEEKRSFLGEIIRRINIHKTHEPAKAKRYIDLLAELEDRLTLPDLIDFTQNPSQMVCHAALRGVARFEDKEAPDQEEMTQPTDCLIQHATGDNPVSKSKSLTLLTDRKSPKVLEFFTNAIKNDIKEFIPYAIVSLGKYGNQDSSKILLPFLKSEDHVIRSTALKSLLLLKNPSAIELLNQKLIHTSPTVRGLAVSAIALSGKTPPLDIMKKLAQDQDGTIKMQLISTLSGIRDQTTEKEQKEIQEIFQLLKNDPNPEIRMKALEGLYRSGMEQFATVYIKKLKTAYGAELNEAIEFICVTLRLEIAGSILVSRFYEDKELSIKDRIAMIDGLAKTQCSEAVTLFFDVINGKWQGDDNPNRFDISMELRAAIYVHELGMPVLQHWKDALNKNDSNEMIYYFINSIRNLEDPGAADLLLKIAVDKDKALWVRKEALLCFPFFRNELAGKKLLAYGENEVHPELSKLAIKIFWNCY